MPNVPIQTTSRSQRRKQRREVYFALACGLFVCAVTAVLIFLLNKRIGL